jgi:hypothetical protein
VCPGKNDESVCPFLLAQYLVGQHNDFVQAVDQASAITLASLNKGLSFLISFLAKPI